MTMVNDTYINALLADSSYVKALKEEMTGKSLLDKLTERMTPEQAQYISDNFKIKAVYNATDGGFNAVVWEGVSGKDYAGQVYVSIRGTQETQDFLDDGGLAAKGVAYTQIKEMVNWWLKETTPNGMMAPQLMIGKVSIPNAPDHNFFAAANEVMSDQALLVNVGAIKSVNAHSLGGYLATAFARIFGKKFSIESVNTFNSAGFSKQATNNIEAEFTNIKIAIGSTYGFDNFTSVAQNNYFAKNGFNVTTNNWDPVGFEQYGNRIEINQEDGVKIEDFGMSNHFMYKITDATAVGNAIGKLDKNVTLQNLNQILSHGSNKMEESYEGVLDGIRKVIQGKDVQKTQTGDESGSKPVRLDYHKNLQNLIDSDDYKSLKEKLTFSTNKPTNARKDIGQFLSLYYLTPFTLQAQNAATSILVNAQGSVGTAWQADKALTPQELREGKATFSDEYLVDRTAMWTWVTKRNNEDITAPTMEGQDFRYIDVQSKIEIRIGGFDDLIWRVIYFGDDTANSKTGGEKSDRLYGGAGDDNLNGGNDVDDSVILLDPKHVTNTQGFFDSLRFDLRTKTMQTKQGACYA